MVPAIFLRLLLLQYFGMNAADQLQADRLQPIS